MPIGPAVRRRPPSCGSGVRRAGSRHPEPACRPPGPHDGMTSAPRGVGRGRRMPIGPAVRRRPPSCGSGVRRAGSRHPGSVCRPPGPHDGMTSAPRGVGRGTGCRSARPFVDVRRPADRACGAPGSRHPGPCVALRVRTTAARPAGCRTRRRMPIGPAVRRRPPSCGSGVRRAGSGIRTGVSPSGSARRRDPGPRRDPARGARPAARVRRPTGSSPTPRTCRRRSRRPAGRCRTTAGAARSNRGSSSRG